MSFIEFKNICKKYAGNDKNSVTDFNLDIEEKEFIAFVGPSGCGKSTTLRMIAGFEEITSGDLFIDGKRVNEVAPADRGISMVFQNYALYPHMTVEKNISYGLKNMKVPADEIKKKVDWAIDILGLEEYRYRKPKNLSGGQRQRIAIARALSVRPRLIILDEPTSAIDVMSQAQILKLLDELKESMELSYVIISHDLSVVNYMSDNIIVMYLGKIVEQGAAEKIFAEPKHPYTKALFNAIPDIHTTSIDELAIVKGEVPSAINPPKGCRFHPRCEFCTERCKQEEPQMHMVDGRMVGCFLYES